MQSGEADAEGLPRIAIGRRLGQPFEAEQRAAVVQHLRNLGARHPHGLQHPRLGAGQAGDLGGHALAILERDGKDLGQVTALQFLKMGDGGAEDGFDFRLPDHGV